MSQSIITEALFALKCIGMGVVITAAYDVLRISRNCIKHGHFWVSLEDFLFWVICAIFIFSVLYRENNGVLRWYCVGGAFLGMVFYGKTISPYLVQFMSTILNKILHLVSAFGKLLARPIKVLFLGVRKAQKKLCKFFTKKKKAIDK